MKKLNDIKLFAFFLIVFLATGRSIATTEGESEKKQIAETIGAIAEKVEKQQLVAVPSTAKGIVVDFQNTLLDVMKQGKNLGFQERCALLDAAIIKSHDVKKSLRTIVGGKAWRHFSEQQKKQLTRVFTAFIVSTYASNFNEFSGEFFEYISEHATKKGNRVVRSILNIPVGNRKKVTFDYALKKNTDGWKIYNIAADGVSDLATRRSEYRRILANKDGFNTLIAIINKKIDNYAKQ